MTARRGSRTPVVGALLAAVLLVLTAGCVGLPDQGPVTVADPEDPAASSAGVDYVPPGPSPGESPAEIVQHFLGAMRASSFQTSVARLFLTSEAADAWAPEQRTIVYEDVSRPSPGPRVSVDLAGVAELDAGGRWHGDPGATTRQVSFSLEQVEGEWRISSLPDALVVPLSWVESRYVQVDLHYLDPGGRILVPSPVYLPGGEQLPTRLVTALLDGPGPELSGVVSSALGGVDPRGLTVDVSATGLATLRLTSAQDAEAPASLSESMIAQLAWTLRQVPSVARVRVEVDDVALPTPDGDDSFSVAAGQRFTPDVLGADASLYGLQDGRLVDVGAGATPVEGAEALAAAGISTLSVSLDGRRAAGQTAEGTVVAVALDDAAEPPTSVRVDGVAQTGWDAAGRMWILDGGRDARVRVVHQGSVETVVVPGITGEPVRRMIVSRDGSRLVAVVGDDGAQRVVVARVRVDERGGVVGAAPQVSLLDVPIAAGETVVDIGWRSPTEVMVLSRLDGGVVELQRAVVDGSASLTDDTSVLVTPAQRLVASPTPGSNLLLVGPEGAEEYDGTRLLPTPAAAGVTALTYVG
ncbi:LpqB family beta-propeller domain-containing protein [Nocardioides zeae]|uniref:LpqB family beta-propeller domain-containing protein n=1 Tax=Nocardioides imazamoxiresistens TaxID=3231893 RepID=A0ABU3Q078_9ACTN|nr:GerMN domain-containing protein [Nocardioides zeae]MDT9594918.1 LpqB family beta-propeller domain-containing protein [Nocardioides zeae]